MVEIFSFCFSEFSSNYVLSIYKRYSTMLSIMILSQTSEYALRIMACIALAQGARALRGKEIATSINCPGPYVSKVLRKLVTAGLLKAEKGHGGGFLLARPASKIRFIDVLEAVQGPAKTKHCIFGWRQCNPNNPCILHNRWTKVNNSFQTWARLTSLSDIQKDATSADWLRGGLNNFKEEYKS